MVPIYIKNSTAELASPLRRHEGGPHLPEDGSPVKKGLHVIAGVRRGQGVEPVAPAIGELHVRQILFVISLTLLAIISGLCVDEIRQRPLSDGFPIRLAAEAGLSLGRKGSMRGGKVVEAVLEEESPYA